MGWLAVVYLIAANAFLLFLVAGRRIQQADNSCWILVHKDDDDDDVDTRLIVVVLVLLVWILLQCQQNGSKLIMPLLPSWHVSCSKRDGTWVQQTPTLSRDSSARESERERDHSFVGYVFVVLWRIRIEQQLLNLIYLDFPKSFFQTSETLCWYWFSQSLWSGIQLSGSPNKTGSLSSSLTSKKITKALFFPPPPN